MKSQPNKIHQPGTAGFRNSKLTVLLAAGFLALGAAQGASTLVTFSVDMSNQVASATFIPGINTVSVNGTFNGWGLPPNLQQLLVRAGSTTVYTNTVNDTVDANDGQIQYKFITDLNGWENTATTHNRAARLPATDGASLVLPTPYFSDAGPAQTNAVTFRVDMAQQIRNGAFNPGTHTVGARGSFNGFGSFTLTNDPAILRTNLSYGTTSNVYVGTFPVAASPNAAQEFKFHFFNGADQWEVPSPVNRNDVGDRYFENATQTLPVVYFSDDSGAAAAVTNAPTSLGEAGRILFPVPVTFTNSVLTPPNQALYVIGDLPQLGAWDVTRAVRMISSNCVSGSVCDWSVRIGLPEGTAYQYKFLFRNECPQSPACYGDPSNGTLEAGPNRTGATPPGPPAPYIGKAIFYYSAWTNISVIYSNHLLGWTSQPMAFVRPGRFPGESLWRASGLNSAGDKMLYFAFTNHAGGLDNSSGVAGDYYETPLDAFVVQEGQLYNYWPPAAMSVSRIESYFLNSTNLAGRMIRTYLPRGYDENTMKRYPVLYMHDGQNLFQGMGSYGSWNSDLNADRLTRMGKLREMIIVGLDNTADRTTDYLPDYCGGNANKYASLILDEVKTRIDSTYRTLTDRDNTATMGSSMGGLVSFYLGWEYPDRFGKIAPMSPFFPACLQTKLRLGPPFAAKPIRIYMDSGTTDPGVPNDDVGDTIEARDNLVKNGFIPNKDVLHVIGYGQTHNEKWWDYRTPFAWTFLFPATEEPNTVLDSVSPPRITNFQVVGASKTVTWTTYRARTYTVQGCADLSVRPLNWINVFNLSTLEARPWNYVSAGITNPYQFFRVVEHAVPHWRN